MGYFISYVIYITAQNQEQEYGKYAYELIYEFPVLLMDMVHGKVDAGAAGIISVLIKDGPDVGQEIFTIFRFHIVDCSLFSCSHKIDIGIKGRVHIIGVTYPFYAFFRWIISVLFIKVYDDCGMGINRVKFINIHIVNIRIIFLKRIIVLKDVIILRHAVVSFYIFLGSLCIIGGSHKVCNAFSHTCIIFYHSIFEAHMHYEDGD